MEEFRADDDKAAYIAKLWLEAGSRKREIARLEGHQQRTMPETTTDERADEQEVVLAKLIVTAPALVLIWVLLRRGCK